MGKKKRRAIKNSRVPHGTLPPSSQHEGCNTDGEGHDHGDTEATTSSITSLSKDEDSIDCSGQRNLHEVDPRSMNLDLEAVQERASVPAVGSLPTMDQEKRSIWWDQLLPDLIQVIFDHCPMLEYIRASSVCRSWASVASKKLHPPAPQLPWLMISESHDSDDDDEGNGDDSENENKLHSSYLCDFFSPFDGQFHRVPVHCCLHERRCCGSSQGWLITADESFNLALLNPFSGSEIGLPSLLQCPTPDVYVRGLKQRHVTTPFFVRKAVLSSDPCRDRDCIVVAVTTSDCLIYCKPDDERWSLVDGNYDTFEDITFFAGRLCAVNRLENLVSSSCKPEACLENMKVAPLRHINEGRCHRYLVESRRGLLLVLRYFGEEGITTSFEVYRLDVGGGKWVEVTDLGDEVLFLGVSHSEAYSARELSGSGFKRNCIYFTGESALLEGKWVEFKGPYVLHDVGEFSLEDRSISTFCTFDSNKRVNSPIWVKPTPW